MEASLTNDEPVLNTEPDILPNQDLDIKNCLKIRYQGPQEGAQAGLTKASVFAKDKGLKLRGVPITANYGAHPQTKDVLIDVYYPVDRDFTSDDKDITFIPRLYLHNCVRITHYGDPKNINETHTALNKYLQENKLIPISAGFSVTSMDGKQDPANFEMDIYISVSPNLI